MAGLGSRNAAPTLGMKVRYGPVGSPDTDGKAGFLCGDHERPEGAAREPSSQAAPMAAG